MIIGLTGGIASGKSTVSKMLTDIGIPVVDADVIAREVVEIGEPAYEKIIETFGADILAFDRNLDRKKLGTIVFNNEKQRLALNEIVHPAIRKRMKDRVAQWQEKGYRTIVLDIPLLFESKLTSMVEKIIVVYVDEELQLERLKLRDQFTDQEAMARISSQMPLQDKILLADEVIHNHGSIAESKDQLLSILRKWDCI
ncbi:dephospho-CoA kinase [Anaerobacillus alkaliphilus]|uniref:Dephospho-CoA kinase n=1 Tax=Anaerobacillus alkaliphilus TaxID=1548597 RepID=A0A4Q0VR90_9BACI|nr:dephospho-CoA kinase [Anaerobacillus alkaliphilus]RXI98515.1 dephospho-CoA kinase [Anaerobacillus alkaliphilus]